MEHTKYNQMDISDDSGYITQNSCSYIKSSSQYQNISESYMVSDTSTSLPYYKTPQFHRTSRDYTNITNVSLNESLQKNFESKVGLYSTPNYYVERAEFASKPIEQSTPSKSLSKYSSNVKLGSPEMNEILYPKLKNLSSSKSRTPQKLFKKSKNYSPAKKRLFDLEKVDPVAFFVNDKRNHIDILAKIMSFLTESDLYSFKRVSSKWRDALNADRKNSNRYNVYIIKLQLDKENVDVCNNNNVSFEKSSQECVKGSPVSPRKRKFNEFIEMGKMLKHGQSMIKCQKCQSPSIVERNISQCQKPMCGYIYCLNCGSFSATGPENFVDKCNSSMLIVDKPKVARRLTDSPPKEIDPNQVPFFLRDSTNTNYYNSNKSDIDDKLYSTNQRKFHNAHNILQSCNRNLSKVLLNVEKKPSVAAVVPYRGIDKSTIAEPPSPPKISDVACSQQSKKRIKRRLIM